MHARPSFYREVHKGIRFFLLDLVVKGGQVDWNDVKAVTAYRSEVAAAFALLEKHAHHEDKFVGPMLAQAAPQVAKVLGGNHDEQEATVAELRARLRAIDPASPEAAASGHDFVLALTRFVGDNLLHMAAEEEIAMTAIWNHFDDAAILATHERLVADISPDVMQAFLRWMLPALNHSERAMFDARMQEAKVA